MLSDPETPRDLGQDVDSGGNLIDRSEEANAEEEEILLFRGIEIKTDGNQIGKWWSTNPYYSYHYSNGDVGEMYVVSLKKQDLDKLAKDVSLESEYQNYFFSEDPPNARRITSEESDALESNTTFSKGNAPGGQIMKTPDNAVEIGKMIFGNK